MIEFSGSFDPGTREWCVRVDDGRGVELASFSDIDPFYALRVALEEARWTPVVTVDAQGRFL